MHLRASQINGCSACVDAGGASATKAGVSTGRLLAVAAWYENPLFDDAERAADERQLGALVLMVAITNFFNRLNTTFRVPAGTRWD